MGAEKIRCAIYTRKSTEEGLEQDFNSLEASGNLPKPSSRASVIWAGRWWLNVTTTAVSPEATWSARD
jgi:hypothetical protein